ncbi:hypothetical protein Tco_0326662 [Tanacetum coccineum]
MHQFWTTIQKVKDTDAYRFKLDKKKFRVDTKNLLMKFFRYVPEFSTKTLLHHLQKKNWLHLFRNLAILALQFILIKCTSLRLLMSMNCLIYELYWSILSRNMNPVVTQQVALDNALVAPEKRLKIERLPPSEDELIPFIHELGYFGKCDMLYAIHTDQIHQPWRTFDAIINRCISGKTTRLDRLIESRAQILWGMYNLKNVDYVALLWEDFMYQADYRDISLARKAHMPYPRFTKVIINHFISKDKTISMRNKINLHTIRDDFILGTLKFVSKTEDYQKYGAVIPDGMINQDIKASKAYKTCHEFASGKVPPKEERKFKKVASPSRKLSSVLEEEPAEKPKKAKKPAKKPTTVPTVGVVIRDTPGVSVSKKKSSAKGNRGKGMELISDAALQALQKSKKDSHMLHASGSDKGTSTKPGFPDVSKDHSKSKNKSWGDSEDDDSNDDVSGDVSKGDNDDPDSDGDSDNDASDNERTDSDEEENPNLTLKHDEEEETQDDKYVHTSDTYASTDEETNDDYREFDEEEYDELYKDVDVKSLDAKREKEGKGDAEMTGSDKDVSQEKSYEQVIDDAHVTLTTTQKTKGSMQSSSISSDFASKFLNLDNVPPAENEVASMMNVKKKAQAEKDKYINIIEKSVKEIIKDEVKSQLPHILPKEISNFATSVIQSTINESRENVVLAKSSSQPQSTYEAATSLTEFEMKNILLEKLEKSKSYRAAEQHKELYDALVKSYQLDKDVFDFYGLKKRKTSKDAEPPKGSKSKDSKSSSSKGTKSQPKSSGKSVQAEEPVFETTDTEMSQDQGGDLGNTKDQPNVEEAFKHDCQIAKAKKPPLTFDELMSTPIDFSAHVLNNLKIENLTQEYLFGPTFNLLKGTCKIRVELEYHFKECYKAVNDRLDWHNLEGHVYPFDLSKPPPLVEDQNRQVVPANYFFNNDLGYLKGGSSSRKYTTSTTKTKAAKYDNIEGIEDIVPTLWSPVKGIITVTRVKVMKWYDYGYLEEIEVRREDHKLYKFKGDVYQTSDITGMTPYGAYNNPQGIIYQDKLKRNRLMRLDELYKFFDGTLSSVRRVLHDIASNLEMYYLPKRRWSKLDRKRSRIMIKEIDQQLFERRLMRNLEKFVGGRDYGNDLRLLERTI